MFTLSMDAVHYIGRLQVGSVLIHIFKRNIR